MVISGAIAGSLVPVTLIVLIAVIMYRKKESLW